MRPIPRLRGARVTSHARARSQSRLRSPILHRAVTSRGAPRAAGMQRAALGALGAAARAAPSRWLSAAPPALRELRELRARTGQPVLRCREALERAGGDLRQAEAWLEAESRRRGWARAAAPGAARARQGLVGVLSEGSAAVMVEVNCETDFVARTPDFQQLVEMAARGVLGHCQGASGTKLLLPEEELAQVRAADGGDLLSEHLALAMGRLGERLALRRAGWLRAPPGGFVATYAHGWVPAGPAVAMGTYGALVACGGPGPGPPPAELRELGRRVAQHVVGMAPTALGTPEDELGGDSETRLLAQGALMEPGVPLGRYLRDRGGLRVCDFLRFQCGEEPPQEPPLRAEGGG
ncbi:LOW QUALITY PROTEIN: elongation factor Ts, mitochondrial [Melozone crissalis]|uniref:LOW QUALITY PROTEIN: elongation factor Ts, mitochondrial n=1 Tax=Melozone crissalis TaxID=40204 RepID=UPI0023DABCD4|nr:LOW QUALITY PROTEIN: elongation factor Ts, mitochondrial [Melozone crissalis]